MYLTLFDVFVCNKCPHNHLVCWYAEYIETGKATERGDVFSYGVVLVELITGRRPTDEIVVDSGLSLVQWVWFRASVVMVLLSAV